MDRLTTVDMLVWFEFVCFFVLFFFTVTFFLWCDCEILKRKLLAPTAGTEGISTGDTKEPTRGALKGDEERRAKTKSSSARAATCRTGRG